ncbi:MAG: hypothetical protein H7X91_04970 [Burkholderiales bacterium]|nr:hypothetical protein [Burkholderiales bacterium]
MDKKTVLVKTAKGVEEIVSRSCKLYDALGPSADDLNRKSNNAKSREKLVRQMRLCFDALRGAVGTKRAEDFRSKCDALLGKV